MSGRLFLEPAIREGRYMVKSGTFQKMATFLQDIPPFNLLSKKALRELIPSLTTQIFLPAEIILTPDDPPTRFLSVIHTGIVNFTIADKGSGQEQRHA